MTEANKTAEEIARRADLSISIEGRDENDEATYGTAYLLTSGEWVSPDSGPKFWAADVEFIGAVLVGYDDREYIIQGHEGCPDEWIAAALELAN